MMKTIKVLKERIGKLKNFDKKLKILHLEDLSSDALLIKKAIERGNIDFEILVVDTKHDFVQAIHTFSPDIILADHSLPSFNSHEALIILHDIGLKIPFILITAAMSDEFAVDIISKGADDYILKDRLKRLPVAIINALIKYRLEAERELFYHELSIREKRFKALVENCSDGIVILNGKGGVSYVSSSFVGMLGYSEAEVMDLEIIEIFHPDDKENVLMNMQDCLAKPGIPVKGCTGRVKHKNGSWRWMEATLTNMFHDPLINGIIDNFRDVTDRKLAEEKLKESEATYRSFFENSMDGIILTMAKGEILAANPAACAMFEMTEEEIREAGRFGITDVSDPRLAAAIKERRITGKVMTEVTLVRKGGKKFPGELTSAAFKNNHGIEKTSMILRDITGRKLAEERINHLNRLYLFLSQINKSIVHSGNEQTIFKEACRIACEVGKFQVAWIGIIDLAQNKINLVEHCGTVTEDTSIYKNITYKNTGPLFQVLRTNHYYVCNNIEIDFELSEWIPYAKEKGFRSMIILPLRKSGEIVSTLNLYSSAIDFFTSEEINLLVDGANDISFALDMFEKQKQKLVADELIKHKEMRLNQAQAVAHLGSWDFNFSEGLLTWSDEALRIYGLSEMDSLQTYESWLSFIHPEDLDHVLSIIKQSKKTLAPSTFNYRIIRNDGIIKHLHIQAEFELNSKNELIGLYGIAHDVTEIKKAGDQLRRSESNLQAIFNNTSEGFILTDKDGIIILFNEKAAEYVFLNMEEKVIVGKSIFDYINVSRLESYKELITKVILGNCIYYDHSYERSNGEIAWFSFDVNPVYENDQVAGICITACDITERKKVEQRLKDSEQFNKGILASLSSHIAVIDSAGTIIAVNKAWDDFAKANEAITSESTSVGSNYFDVCRKATIAGDIVGANVLNGIQSVFESENKTFSIEYPCHSPNEQRWFIIHVSNFGSDKSKIVISHQDISERKKAEEENKFKANLLNTIGQAAIATDVNGIINYWNRSAEEIFGWSQDEALGKNIVDITPSFATKDQAIEILNQLKAGRTWSGEFDVKRKDGTVFPAFVANAPIYNEDHQLSGIIGISTDITERKKAEEVIRKSSAELKELSQDLNNIMNSSLDIICTIDIDGKFVKVSEASERIWGYKPNEIQGRLFMNFILEEDVSIFVSTADEIIKGLSVSMFENRYKHKNGKIVPMLWSARWDENDKLMYCIAKDATEKKRLEKAFENERQQFHDLFMQAPTSMGILRGPDHVFDVANPLYLQLIGKKDIVGKSVKQVLPEVEHQGFIEILDSVYNTGEAFVANEMPVKVDKNGTGKLVDLYLNFIYQAYKNFEGNIEGILFFAVDVTEQVISRNKIEESEKRYRQIVETAQEGIWVIDENNITTFVNQKMCDILGYSCDEMVGKPNLFFKDDEGRKMAILNFEKRKHETAETLKSSFVTKDGKLIWTQVSTNLIFVEGIYKGALCMVADITEQILVEETLKENEQKYRELAAQLQLESTRLNKAQAVAKLGSWEINLITLEVTWSKELHQIYGTSQNDFPKNHADFVKLIHPDDIGKVEEAFIYSFENKAANSVEHRIITIQGNEKNVIENWEVSINVNGKPVRSSGTCQDITDRKVAEVKIIENEAKLREAQRIAQVGSWEIDILEHRHEWSDEFCRIVGLEVGEVSPSEEAFLSVIHPEDLPLVLGTIKRGFKNLAETAFTFRIIKKNEEIGYATAEWKFQYDRYQKPIRLAGILRDITRQKVAENERSKMIADIIQRNEDLEQFSYIVSHNLRAPVANIIGLNNELNYASHSIEIKEMFKKELSFNVYRLDNVINDLNIILQTKREVTEKKEKVIFSDLVRNIKASIENLIKKERVQIKIDFSEADEYVTVKSYLHSIFYNLISNSIKYRRAGNDPVIIIKTKKVNSHLFLTFKDNGSGIDLEKKGGQVFGLYKRFHTHIEGKGMGLFMVKTQVETLGGRISIQSKVDQGTEFTIEFEITNK